MSVQRPYVKDFRSAMILQQYSSQICMEASAKFQYLFWKELLK